MIDRTYILSMPSPQKPGESTALDAATPAVEEDTEQQDVQRDAVFHAEAMQTNNDFPGAI